jgi:hypothetical protein
MGRRKTTKAATNAAFNRRECEYYETADAERRAR